MLNRRQIIIKLVLIFVAEAIAMSLNYGISSHVYPIEHPVAANVVGGAILAMIVVQIYNTLLLKRRERIEGELRELTRLVLKKLPENMDDRKRR